MLLDFAAGFGTGFGLIVAIGAQNAFVLRQGLRREHVGVVVGFCAAADALLICLGVAGIGSVVERAPGILDAIRWGGVVFLLGYALIALRRALHPGELRASGQGEGLGRGAAIATVAALTLLNPHVYLDTVLLVGSIANQHGDPGRWVFAAGATLASIVWFSALGHGARLLASVFARPAAWRVLDLVIAAVMVTIAVGLVRQ